MIKLRILDKQELSEWNSVVERFPDATLFHTIEWLNFLETTSHLEKLPLGIYEDCQMVGVFPALLTRKGPFKILGSPLTGWGTPHMGPLVEVRLLDEVMEAFNDFVRQLKVDYLEVCFPQAELSLPSMGGYTSEPKGTYILQMVNNEETMWAMLRGRCRNMVKHAIKSKVEIREVEERGWVEQLYPMLLDSFAKSGFVPSKAKQTYYDLWDFLKPVNRVRVLLAEHDGKPIACGAWVTHNCTITQCAQASLREYHRLCPNNLIQWHIIKWASANGFQRYDLNGKGIPSIDRFKESLGSEAAWHTTYARAANPMARIGKSAYARMELTARKLRHRMYRLREMTRRKGPDEGTDPNVS